MTKPQDPCVFCPAMPSPAPCRFTNCINYPAAAQASDPCDRYQAAMCEHIRAGGPRPDFYHYGEPGPIVYERAGEGGGPYEDAGGGSE